MKIDFNPSEEIKKLYRNLITAESRVKKDFNRLMDEDFGERDFEKEGRRILLNIKAFEEGYKKLKNYLENDDEIDERTEEIFEQALDKMEFQTIPKIDSMKEKIQSFDVHIDLENEEDEEKKVENLSLKEQYKKMELQEINDLMQQTNLILELCNSNGIDTKKIIEAKDELENYKQGLLNDNENKKENYETGEKNEVLEETKGKCVKCLII